MELTVERKRKVKKGGDRKEREGDSEKKGED